MSKDETRRGNPALPTGQSRRGFPAADSTTTKNPKSMMSIGAPSDGGVVTTPGVGYGSVSAGFPGTDSPNAAKDGDTWLPDDNLVNRGYAYTGGPVNVGGVTDPGANRQRFGIDPPTPPDAQNGPVFENPQAVSGEGSQS